MLHLDIAFSAPSGRLITLLPFVLHVAKLLLDLFDGLFITGILSSIVAFFFSS